jgi:hypothetical protein
VIDSHSTYLSVAKKRGKKPEKRPEEDQRTSSSLKAGIGQECALSDTLLLSNIALYCRIDQQFVNKHSFLSTFLSKKNRWRVLHAWDIHTLYTLNEVELHYNSNWKQKLIPCLTEWCLISSTFDRECTIFHCAAMPICAQLMYLYSRCFKMKIACIYEGANVTKMLTRYGICEHENVSSQTIHLDVQEVPNI